MLDEGRILAALARGVVNSNRFNYNTHLADAVPAAIIQLQGLGVDEQLVVLWYAYAEMDRSITLAAPGAARLQLAEGLLNSFNY